MTALLLLIIALLLFGVGGVMKGLFWAFILGAAFFIAAALTGFTAAKRG